jgi:F420-dependent oxidoreductase-like protein
LFVPMDLCLMIEGQEGVTWPQWQALALACEQHSIPALFRSDHYLDSLHPERGSLDAWGTLNALAAVTSTLRLGTMVSPATFRHPSTLAKLATTADQISDGRIELGLGAGWNQREHAAYGFPFPDTRRRMDMLEEQLQVILGNWSDGPFSFEGEHYQLHDLEAQPKPVQRPHPPLIMGGNAGPRSCALAARFADEYNTVYPTVAEVRERRAQVLAACDRAGREAIPFSIMTAVIAGADQKDLRDRLTRVARVRWDGPDAMMAERPPGWVIGIVEDVAEQLTALREAGVRRVICQHLAPEDLDFIALLGSELAPLVA